MGLFDRFKKTEKVEKKVEKKSAPKKAEIKVAKEKKPAAKAAKTVKAETPKVPKKEFSDAWKIIAKPMVTEKSTALNAINHYTFRVTPEATKNEIKKAVQDLYGVKVERVRIINLPGKVRRLGQNQGFRSGFKKAVVVVAAGQSIEIIAG